MSRPLNLKRDLPIASPCPKLPTFADGAVRSHCPGCDIEVHLLDPARPQQLAALRGFRGALCVAYAVSAPVLLSGDPAQAQAIDNDDETVAMETVEITGGGIGRRQLESLFEELVEPWPSEAVPVAAQTEGEPP
jgi:hypothetical protein